MEKHIAACNIFKLNLSLCFLSTTTGLDTSDLGLQDNVKPTISNTDEHNFKDGQHFTVSNLDFYGNIFGNNENIMDKLAQIEKEIKEDEDIATKSALLIKLLQVSERRKCTNALCLAVSRVYNKRRAH